MNLRFNLVYTFSTSRSSFEAELSLYGTKPSKFWDLPTAEDFGWYVTSQTEPLTMYVHA